MTQKNKLLFVTAISPFPHSSGGAVRIYSTIKELSTYFDMYLVIFKDSSYRPTKRDTNFLKKHSKSYGFFDTNPQKSEQVFFDFHQPYWFSDWYNPETITFINQTIKEHQIHTVHIELTQLLYLYDYLPSDLYKIFVAEDISTISFKRRLQEIVGIKTKIVHFFRWLEIYYYEKKYLSKYNLVAAVSNTDQKVLQNVYKLKNTICVPNGIENIAIRTITTINKSIRLGYFGSFSHPPNRYAFLHFINHIAPILEKRGISYKFYLAGKNDPKEVYQIISKSKLKRKGNVIDLGFVPNVDDFYKHIDILVTPLSSGSGSRIKILESLGLGVPIVSTPIGAEGNNFRTIYLKTASSNQEFVEKILLTHKQIVNGEMAADKTNLIQQITDHLWSNIFKNYYQSLSSFINEQPTTPPNN